MKALKALIAKHGGKEPKGLVAEEGDKKVMAVDKDPVERIKKMLSSGSDSAMGEPSQMVADSDDDDMVVEKLLKLLAAK